MIGLHRPDLWASSLTLLVWFLAGQNQHLVLFSVSFGIMGSVTTLDLFIMPSSIGHPLHFQRGVFKPSTTGELALGKRYLLAFSKL